MHPFTRFIATYIVLPAGLIGAFALGTAVNADAAPTAVGIVAVQNA
jgi:hypothetical protein